MNKKLEQITEWGIVDKEAKKGVADISIILMTARPIMAKRNAIKWYLVK